MAHNDSIAFALALLVVSAAPTHSVERLIASIDGSH